jgi:hypothetical protein
VTAEFVVKPNTYYAQNIVKAPFFLRVISVGGRALKEPVVIEYFLETEKKEKKRLERTGAVQEFEAYETLYQPISATPWLGEMEQGSRFYLQHLLHIRTVRKPANQALQHNDPSCHESCLRTPRASRGRG